MPMMGDIFGPGNSDILSDSRQRIVYSTHNITLKNCAHLIPRVEIHSGVPKLRRLVPLRLLQRTTFIQQQTFAESYMHYKKATGNSYGVMRIISIAAFLAWQ